MVGDGVSDGPALAAADVGLAMASGTDVAMHTAGIALMRPEPRLVADAIGISRATSSKIGQNLFWAFIYNVICLPLAPLRSHGAVRRERGCEFADAAALEGRSMSNGLTIGRVAELAGVSAKTIRYYEQIGLVRPAKRTRNGYRAYDEHTVQRLRFVKRARGLGFPLKDVEDLLALWSDRRRASAKVKALAERHIAKMEHKMKELEGMRATLQHLVDRCHGDHRPDCPILDDLAGDPAPAGRDPPEP